MFVNIVRFPPLRPGQDAAFRRWFAESTRAYARHPGFISRRLLQPRKAGEPYAAIVEHESYDTFMAMHTSPTRAALREQAEALFAGNPSPAFYEEVRA